MLKKLYYTMPQLLEFKSIFDTSKYLITQYKNPLCPEVRIKLPSLNAPIQKNNNNNNFFLKDTLPFHGIFPNSYLLEAFYVEDS